MHKKVKIKDLFSLESGFLSSWFDRYEYPWELLPEIGSLAKKMIDEGPPGYSLYADGVLVGEGVTIAPTATILPPAIIGSGTEIRPGAYIRGNVIIGENCVVGNSTELKNCILLDGVQVPHYNYVGDSVLGNKAHLGAGAVCSNLKADKKPVVIRGEQAYETGLKKVGAFLGDGADVGCNCVLNPGTVIGKGSRVYPLTSLRGVYPEKVIVKKTDEFTEIQ